jgi:hypothetical protein
MKTLQNVILVEFGLKLELKLFGDNVDSAHIKKANYKLFIGGE